MEMYITEDIDLVKRIFTDDDIWSKVGEGRDKEDFNPTFKEGILALAIKTDDVIGLHVYTEESDGVYFHPMILKKYRREYAKDAIKMGVEWYNKNIGNNLLCEIPTMHKSTINLAKKIGFKPINCDGVKTKMRYV